MLAWPDTWPCKLISSSICLGRNRPTLKACSLLMNLTAMTGFGLSLGTALRILLSIDCQRLTPN